MKKIVIIAGATATGKSGVAIELAKQINSEIISADSMQIYRGMDIGTAKVTAGEAHGVSHNLIDIADPNDEFSVSEYVSRADREITRLCDSGMLPIIVGGTGFYIDGIMYPHSYGIGRDDELRERLSQEYDIDGGAEMYAKMMTLDPVDTAKYHMNNKHRLVRAMEIYLLSGKCKSEFAIEKLPKYDIDMVVLDVEREVLYSKINERVENMFDAGLVGEVENLINNGADFGMQSMQGIGYKEFRGWIEGEVTLDAVKELIKKNSRNYAKRQITWFKQYHFAKFLPPMEAQKYLDNEYKS